MSSVPNETVPHFVQVRRNVQSAMVKMHEVRNQRESSKVGVQSQKQSGTRKWQSSP